MLPYPGFAATGLSPFLGFLGNHSDDWVQWAWSITAGISAFYGCFYVGRFQLRLKRVVEAIDRTSALDHKFGATATMLFQSLQELSLAPDIHARGKVIGQLREVVIASVRELGGDDTRVTVYQFEHHDGHKEDDCLVRVGHRGRYSNKPRRMFCASRDVESQRVVDLAKEDSGILYSDITQVVPHGMVNPENRSYRTTMLAPIRTEEKSFGMISVDDPTPAIFAPRHLVILNALAKILATCEALDTARVSRPTNPTMSAPTDPGNSQAGPLAAR